MPKQTDLDKDNQQCVSFIYDRDKIKQLRILAGSSGNNLSDLLRDIADKALIREYKL